MSNMKRRLLSSILSIALLLSMLYIMPISTTVHANTRTVADGVYRIKNVMSGRFIDVNGGYTTSGTNVHQWEIHVGQQQMWQVTYLNNGAYRISPLHAPNLALNADGGSSASGTNVNIATSNGSTAQQWTIVENSDGTFRIAPIYAPNSVLDVGANGVWDNGGNIALWSSHTGNNQKFVFESVQTVESGVYMIKSVNSGKYMDGGGANWNVRQLDYNGGSVQQWRITYLNNGFYKIASLGGTNWVLDVNNAGSANGTNVQIWGDSSNNYAQQFSITKHTDGRLIISPRCANGKVVDVENYSMASGANISLFAWSNTSNQKWIFEPNVPVLLALHSSYKTMFASDLYPINLLKNAAAAYQNVWGINLTLAGLQNMPANAPNNESDLIDYVRNNYTVTNNTAHRIAAGLFTFDSSAFGWGYTSKSYPYNITNANSLFMGYTYPRVVRTLQHEISHNYGTLDTGSVPCNSTQVCIMNPNANSAALRHNPNYGIDVWCDGCKNGKLQNGAKVGQFQPSWHQQK